MRARTDEDMTLHIRTNVLFLKLLEFIYSIAKKKH